MRAIWAIIPIKDLSRAKQRLSSLLNGEERRRLGLAMLRDVLDALVNVRGLSGVMLASCDADACSLARRYGARIAAEPGAQGLNAAVTHAAQLLAGEGVDAALVLHGDVPLAPSAGIERMLAALGPSPAIAIAPDRALTGTNAMAVSPPDLIQFHYGRDSFAAHLREAARLGVSPQISDLPGLAFDVDAPDDLFTLAGLEGAGHAQKLLRELDLESRAQTAISSVR